MYICFLDHRWDSLERSETVFLTVAVPLEHFNVPMKQFETIKSRRRSTSMYETVLDMSKASQRARGGMSQACGAFLARFY